MSFYGIISVEIEYKNGLDEDTKRQIVKTMEEYLTVDYADNDSVTFRGEENFTYGTIDELRDILQELKDNNKIERAGIFVWNLDEPDDEIYI